MSDPGAGAAHPALRPARFCEELLTMPTVYLVLGLPGSGRHEIVQHLLEDGLPEARAVALYQAVGDGPAPAASHPAVTPVPYVFADGHFTLAPGATPPAEPDAVFFFLDGRASPIDQLEVLPAWLHARGWELARLLLVVHCGLAAAHPEVALWHEAGVHFADCVLLNRRDGVSNFWIQEFRKQFSEARYPCHFALVKNGRVDNAPLLLFPEARRLSLIFEDIDPVDQLELDEENLPEEPFTLENKPDPYFERNLGGQRRKPVPEVSAFLK